MKFLDEAKIYVRGGDGGRGCSSMRREKRVPFGGPDGGNGGRGGDVVAVCVAGLNTLIDYRYQQHFKAPHGVYGKGENRTGANGPDLRIKVPAGTVFLANDKETVVAELLRPGEEIILAHGGRGGRGNAMFKTSTDRAPRKFEPGGVGEEFWLWMRLKLIADAGLVGLPNAGKSTFLSVVSAARPKIADYPFTTLAPVLGVVAVGGEEFVLADLPGLIEGAHEGKGLGVRFLGHVERCNALVHLVDATVGPEEAIKAYRTVRHELKSYGAKLEKKPELIALNKIDALQPDEIAAVSAALAKATRRKVYAISAAAGTGVPELLRALHKKILAAHEKSQAADAPDKALAEVETAGS